MTLKAASAAAVWLALVSVAEISAQGATPVRKPSHAGIVQRSGRYWLELLVGQHEVEVWVTDRKGVPVVVEGGESSLEITRDREKQDVALTWHDDHLTGPYEVDDARSLKVRATVMIGGRRQEARFEWRLSEDRSRLFDQPF